MEKLYFHRKNCRICGSRDLEKILDLGSLPLANSFLSQEEMQNSEIKIPLAVYFCKDCCLLQLLDVANPEILFSNYCYETSTSKELVGHFKETAEVLCKKFIKSDNDLFIDIGGNDGTLLSFVKQNYKCRVLNIDPAKNISEKAEQTGIETVSNFFTALLAEKILKDKGKAKVIAANNVFAHIDDLENVIEGVKILLADDGVFVFEAHWVANLLGLKGKYGGFDQIYHEHLNYYSLHAILKSIIFEKFGLHVFDVDLLDVHGQLMRIYVSEKKEVSERVKDFVGEELNLSLDKIETFKNFSKEVKKIKKDLSFLLADLKSQNKKIAGYGAPGKSTTLLNFCGIGKNTIDYIIDESLLKQGLYSPGTRIPILPVSELYKRKPDYMLLLAWNYTDFILEKEKKLREEGVKFIIPLPKIKIV